MLSKLVVVTSPHKSKNELNKSINLVFLDGFEKIESTARRCFL